MQPMTKLTEDLTLLISFDHRNLSIYMTFLYIRIILKSISLKSVGQSKPNFIFTRTRSLMLLKIAIKHKGLKVFTVYIKLSRVMRKPTFWFLTWSDTNQAVQLQKMARGLKFRI